MEITTVDAISNNNVPIVERGDNTKMDKFDFLKMLTVQLANQDPTNPMDTDQMAQQQVQYAELEQLMNLNTSMESFIQDQNDLMLGIASVFNTLESTSFLGKDVEIYTSKVLVGEDGVENQLYCDLSEQAKVSYSVTDADGNIIKTTDLGEIAPGERIPIEWDGRDASGNLVPAGEYFIKLNATDMNNAAMSGKTYSSFNVTSIDFREGTPMLTLEEGSIVPVTEIVAVLEPESV